ncbi:MAG TPA: tetratricopeptide repeat protein [Gammaproteobacteria bacterium]|nr:tetratricopeptide repeat protein [Gammaproteobacteria bacterium]
MSRFESSRRAGDAAPSRAVVRLAVVLAAVLAACGTAVADTRGRAADTRVAAAERGDTGRSRGRSAAPKRTPARLEVVDATAFTITEQARISGDARTQYDAAVALLEQQRYAEGVALMLQVAEKAPDLTAPQINLGIAYERMGDLTKAEASFTKALELNPNHPVVYDELGLLYRATGRFAEARASYEKALAIHPGFHFAHRNLAILCDVYLDDLPCAVTHYEAYAQAEPDDKEVQKWIADLHNRLGR